jgi:mannose-6-phosphate isomerase
LLAELYAKPLPDGVPIGESWEVADRPGDESVIENGCFAGKSLRWLMENHGEALMGRPVGLAERFPWLAKILDARQDLSLQVHPPAALAPSLGGEPKTEIWYIAAADPGAKLYVGLRRGITRDEFAERIRDGNVAECFHQVAVTSGDVMFLPSGRVHALGGGIVLFEIQQNSDTTYRVFDWNRVGLDGKPRQLHVSQSMASIDFDDFEPDLIRSPFRQEGPGRQINQLVDHETFRIELVSLDNEAGWSVPEGRLFLVAAVTGRCKITSADGCVDLPSGTFALIPASARQVLIRATGPSKFLTVTEARPK